MDGIIAVKGLFFPAILGINPEERLHEQKVALHFEITCDFAACRGNSDTAGTIDWAWAAHEARSFIQHGRYHLAETAALELAEHLLKHPAAKAVKVELCKLEADVGATELCARIELTR